MAIYAVGDLQGCYDPFRRLLDAIDFDPDRDTLWLVGDLVNRGPKSLKTLRFVRDMGDAAITVLGNHDLHLVSRHAGIAGPKRRDTLDAVLTADDADELVDWLRHRPLLHREAKIVVVHAGLLPGWTPKGAEKAARKAERRLRDSAELSALLKWPVPETEDEDPQRVTIAALTRLRTCTAAGRLCPFSGPADEAPAGR